MSYDLKLNKTSHEIIASYWAISFTRYIRVYILNVWLVTQMSEWCSGKNDFK